jgi:hypothetical protein
MKKTGLRLLAGIGMVALVVGATGCKTPASPAVERQTYIEPVRFSPESYQRDVRVKDENDPQQLVNFALSMASRGRHTESAGFFQEAANKFHSEDNELAVSCRAAAANEFLLGGDINAFRQAVQALKGEMNRFQSAALDKPTAVVLALGEISLDVDKPSPTTPQALWDLYENGKAK